MISCLIEFCVVSFLPIIGSNMTAKIVGYPSPNIMKQARVIENDVCMKRYHSHPFLVKLFRISSRGTLWKSCEGTLLDGNHVLTAGHCCEYPDQVAHTKINQDQIESRSVIRMRKHNEYIFRKYYKDVCVMTLESDIYSGYSPYKSRFPKKSMTTSELEKMCNKGGVITVWRHLVMAGPVLIVPNCANEKIIPFQECVEQVERTSTLPVHSDNVCTLEEDSCEIEPGGPLMCDDIQIGISSWRVEDCSEKAPKIYARVDQYLNFIWDYNMDTKSFKNCQSYRPKMYGWPYLVFITLVFGILPNRFVV